MEQVIEAATNKEDAPILSSVQNPPPNGKRNKRSGLHDSLDLAYQGILFTERSRSHQPGTPSRFFASSYDVSFVAMDAQEKQPFNLDHSESSSSLYSRQQQQQQQQQQVVHCHVNGLCVVTAGENKLPSNNIRNISFLVDQAPACSTGQRRKRQAKMLKRGVSTTTTTNTSTTPSSSITTTKEKQSSPSTTTTGTVTPSTVLAELTLENGETVPLRACVWGTVLELNHNLTSTITLLEKDPLLDGYLAILSPTGAFPPPSSQLSNAPFPDDNAADDSGANANDSIP